MTAGCVTDAVLLVLALSGVVWWTQRLLDRQRPPTDAQRFEESARVARRERRRVRR